MQLLSIVLLAVTLLAAAGMGRISWRVYRRRPEPGMQPFAVLTALFGSLGAALSLVYLGYVANVEPSIVDLVFVTLTAVVFTSGIPWIVFVLQYTGRSSLITRGRVALLTVPGVVYVGSVLAMQLRWPSNDVASMDGGLSMADVLLWNAYLFSFLVLVGLIVVGALLLLRTTHAYSHMSMRMGVLLATPVVVLVPLVLTLPYVAMNRGEQAGGVLVAAGILLGVGCFELVLRHDDAFGSTSAAAGPVGRETILAEHSDAVFTLDAEHRIVETNAAARETFGLSSDGPLGEPIEDVLEARVEDLTTDAPLGVNTVDDLWTESTVFIETSEGRRRFHAEVSDLSDERGRQLGLVISLEDVTERALREQRIGILNRVLRHNLRNKLSIVRGHAEMVPEAGEELEEYAETIEAAATDLLALGERARDVERLLAVDEDAEAQVGTVVEDVVTELQDDCDEVAFQLDVGDPATASIPWEALEFVTAELCENAAKHNDAADPRVTVQCDRAGDWAQIDILDNGPTLSDQELVAIDADEESPLEHGSGLGLWSVRWVVTAFGGQFTVEENEPRGSVVTLLLPIAEGDRDDSVSEGHLAAEASVLALD